MAQHVNGRCPTRRMRNIWSHGQGLICGHFELSEMQEILRLPGSCRKTCASRSTNNLPKFSLIISADRIESRASAVCPSEIDCHVLHSRCDYIFAKWNGIYGEHPLLRFAPFVRHWRLIRVSDFPGGLACSWQPENQKSSAGKVQSPRTASLKSRSRGCTWQMHMRMRMEMEPTSTPAKIDSSLGRLAGWWNLGN